MAAPNVPPWTEIAQSMQQTMGQAGIKVTIEPMELKAVISQYRARQHQIIMLSWGPDYPDPHTNADTFARNPRQLGRRRRPSRSPGATPGTSPTSPRRC